MGLFDFFKKKQNQNDEHLQPSPKQQVDEAQKEFINDSSANAERIIQSFNEKYDGAFDYSVESLESLDELLDNFADFKDQMDEEMMSDLIAQAGSYIFEVARRNFGGKYYWYEQLNQPIFVTGQPEFETSILAFEKVKGRIENGTEDNIPFYFAGYVERVKNKQSGMIV
ncbi:MAG: hypothetical protein Q4G16_10885 [Cruoricaptor ignavus]|nr:hypothetical protein [Cruoricaptor ignavus]